MPPRPIRKPIEVFCSYAHKDESLLNELAKHLSILKRQGIIDVWYDQEITAGGERQNEIDCRLNSADVILLLISADFLDSKYCYDAELRRALERHYSGEARVIPIIMRPVDWSNAPFSKLQVLPKQTFPENTKAITTCENQDAAFTDVAKGIRRAVKELAEPRPPLNSRDLYPPTFQRQSTSYQPSSHPRSSPLPVPIPPLKLSGSLSQTAWGAIALIPLLWVSFGIWGLEDTASSNQDLMGKFSMGCIGGLLSGVLGAVAWYNMRPTTPLEKLLLYIFLCSITGGGVWSVTGGENWISGLFVGGLTSFFTYWWIHRVCVKA